MVFDIGWLLAIIDLCSLIDNLFVDTQYDKSLLQYWKDAMGGYGFLLKVESARDHSLEDKVRKLRNTLAAHIDDSSTLSDIYEQYEKLDIETVHAYTVMLLYAFRNACRLDIRTKIFLVQNLVLLFEEALKELDITIKQGSTLEKLCLNVIDIYEKYRNAEQRPDGSVDIRKLYRDLLGLSDFAAKIVSCRAHNEFSKLKPHLALLNKGAVVQNSTSSVLDQSNNKLFELFVACLCMGAGSQHVELDDPNSSAGDNPDVLASFDGVNWGFGCKALHSKHPMTIYKNLEKAVKQIERSPVETGLPVLSAKNIIDHDSLWPVKVDGFVKTILC